MKGVDSGPIAFVVNGMCGAFVAALAAISVQFGFASHIEWMFVKICAGFGFFLAAFFGQRALDFLSEFFWWSKR